MPIGYNSDEDPDHEDLAMAFVTLVARQVRDGLIADGVDEETAISHAESAAFSVAMTFDQDAITVNGKRYKPCLSFTKGNSVPVPLEDGFDLHDYAASVLEFDEYD